MLVSLPLPFPSSELYIVESGKASCTLMSVVVAQCFSYLSFSSFKRESIKKKSGTLPLTSVHFSCSVMSDSLQPHGLQHARLPCPSPTPRACLKLMSIESVMPSNHFILCCPLLLLLIFPSIRVFSNESVLHIR